MGDTFRRMGSYLLVGALANGIKTFVEGLITQADQLKHNSEMLGLSTEELQKYQYVANLMQVPVQQTAVALRFFNRAIGEASFGTKSAVKVFGQLGIAVKDANGQVRPTDELLFEVADKLKGVHSQAQRTAIAMRLLGRSGAAMLPVLQQGGEALRTAFKDVDELGGGFNDKFIEQAHETDVQLKRLKMGWRSVAVAIATEVLPWMNKQIERSIRTVKHLIDLAKHTYAFRTALMALAAGTLALALTRLFKLFSIGKMTLRDLLTFFVKYPLIALFTAAILALYIAFDDLYTFLKGGDSVIGRFLDSIGGAGTALEVWKELKTALEDVWEALKPVGDSLKVIGVDMAKAFVSSIPGIVKWGGIFTTFVIDLLARSILLAKQFANWVAHGFMGTDETPDLKASREGYEALHLKLEALTRNLDSLTNPPKRGPNVAAPGSDYGPQPAGTQPGKTDFLQIPPITITSNVTVHGASDPKGTAAAVSKETKGAIKDALTRHRDAFNAVTAGSPVTGH